MDLIDQNGDPIKKNDSKSNKKSAGKIYIVLYDNKSMDFDVSGDKDVLKAMLKTSLRNTGFKQLVYDAVKEDMEESLQIAKAQQAVIKNSLCDPFKCMYNSSGYCTKHHAKL